MQSRKPAIFDLELRPSQSLERRHMRIVMAGVAIVFLLLGLRLLILGAWPTVPFMLIDLLILGWALKASRRASEQSEHLRLDADGLELVRIDARGMARRAMLQPYWTKVELETLGKRQNRLWLRSGGKRLALGHFLPPEERVEIARVIEDGLRRLQRNEF